MSRSATTRAKLGHPVIDADAHLLEFEPVYHEYVMAEGGAAGLAAYKHLPEMAGTWYRADSRRRRHERIQRPAFGLPTRPLDLATVMVPKLLYQRLDAMGIDYMVVNPTTSLAHIKSPDPGIRRALARAINRCHADITRELADRMTVAALIPTVTPQEAIDELEFAVQTLGFKLVCIDHAVRRPVPAFAEAYPDAPPSLARHAQWIDTYALESPYDYDPFWKRCVELKVNVTCHLPAYWGARTSITNYVYNHLGQFADSGEALVKALVLGGVTHRFPGLRVGLLEGGVGWACRLYCDMVEHFEKRNGKAMENYHPDRLDDAAWKSLIAEHGGPRLAALVGDSLERTCPGLWYAAGWCLSDRAQLDEWAQSGITEPEGLRDQFMSNFFFGCEADDRTIAWAFDQRRLPMEARLRPMFGSDIGHWDVLDMEAVVAEAHELVEHGILTPDQFREFSFGNALMFYTSTNPDFFRGTLVEGAR